MLGYSGSSGSLSGQLHNGGSVTFFARICTKALSCDHAIWAENDTEHCRLGDDISTFKGVALRTDLVLQSCQACVMRPGLVHLQEDRLMRST